MCTLKNTFSHVLKELSQTSILLSVALTYSCFASLSIAKCSPHTASLVSVFKNAVCMFICWCVDMCAHFLHNTCFISGGKENERTKLPYGIYSVRLISKGRDDLQIHSQPCSCRLLTGFSTYLGRTCLVCLIPPGSTGRSLVCLVNSPILPSPSIPSLPAQAWLWK